MVCTADQVPVGPDVRVEHGWRALEVAGPLDFSMIGVLASLTARLAQAQVSVFVISTYDTDYVLVRAAQLDPAIDALRGDAHNVHTGTGEG